MEEISRIQTSVTPQRNNRTVVAAGAGVSALTGYIAHRNASKEIAEATKNLEYANSKEFVEAIRKETVDFFCKGDTSKVDKEFLEDAVEDSVKMKVKSNVEYAKKSLEMVKKDCKGAGLKTALLTAGFVFMTLGVYDILTKFSAAKTKEM
jgi:hypothetical protein